jgi:regulatory protein
MTQRSDDGLAPVIYLPGVHPSSERPTEPAAPDRPAPVPARLALGDDVDVDGPEEVDGSADVDGQPSDPAPEAGDRAHEVSLRALTRRGMSRREIERALRSRDLDEETIAGEVERLEAVGLIDDMALAQNLVGTLQERKGYGRQAVAAELTRRLLAPAAIEYALELIETSDELARAHEVARKRAVQLRGYDHDTAVRRLSGYLMRRGYTGSTVRAAVEQALPRVPQSTVRFR